MCGLYYSYFVHGHVWACVWVCVSFGPLALCNTRNNSRECIIFSMPLASLTGSVTWGFAHLHSRLHEWAYSVWELIHVWDISGLTRASVSVCAGMCAHAFLHALRCSWKSVPDCCKLLTGTHYWPLTSWGSESLSHSSVLLLFMLSLRSCSENFKKLIALNVDLWLQRCPRRNYTRWLEFLNLWAAPPSRRERV